MSQSLLSKEEVDRMMERGLSEEDLPEHPEAYLGVEKSDVQSYINHIFDADPARGVLRAGEAFHAWSSSNTYTSVESTLQILLGFYTALRTEYLCCLTKEDGANAESEEGEKSSSTSSGKAQTITTKSVVSAILQRKAQRKKTGIDGIVAHHGDLSEVARKKVKAIVKDLTREGRMAEVEVRKGGRK